MSRIDRKTRIREYKATPRLAGVFQVRNTTTGKSLLGTTTDLPSMLNRQRFQLENGSHPNKELQRDWNEQAPNMFSFEILDQLEPSEEPTYDPTEDLAVLGQMWLDKLTASGEKLYQELKRGT